MIYLEPYSIWVIKPDIFITKLSCLNFTMCNTNFREQLIEFFQFVNCLNTNANMIYAGIILVVSRTRINSKLSEK